MRDKTAVNFSRKVNNLICLERNNSIILISATALAFFSLELASNALADDIKSNLNRDEIGSIIYQQRYDSNTKRLGSQIKSLMAANNKQSKYEELGKYMKYVCTEINPKYRICYTNYYLTGPAYAQPGHEHRTEWSLLIVFRKQGTNQEVIDKVHIESRATIE